MPVCVSKDSADEVVLRQVLCVAKRKASSSSPPLSYAFFNQAIIIGAVRGSWFSRNTMSRQQFHAIGKPRLELWLAQDVASKSQEECPMWADRRSNRSLPRVLQLAK